MSTKQMHVESSRKGKSENIDFSAKSL